MNIACEFANRLASLLRRERSAMADFLVALADFDRRRLWVELGHVSLFSFLRRELGLSAGAAQYRKTAAELLRRFPEVEAALREGRLCLSSVVELAKVLTPENAAEILPRFFGLSSREAAFVAASIRPVENPPRREVVAFVRAMAASAAGAAEPVRNPGEESPFPAPAADDVDSFRAPETPAVPVGSAPVPAHESRRPTAPATPAIEPLDADLARLHMTVSRRFLAKLQATRDALSHSRPSASAEEALEACMDLLLARHAKRRGLVEKPRKAARPGARSASWRTIPAAVRREVWRRAGGRCEWQLHEGGACGSTLRLEFAHVTPRARGGPATSENLKLHCRARNGRSGPAGRDRICSSLVGALLQDGRRRAAGPSYAAPLPFPAAMSTSRAAEICTLSPRPPFSRKRRSPFS